MNENLFQSIMTTSSFSTNSLLASQFNRLVGSSTTATTPSTHSFKIDDILSNKSSGVSSYYSSRPSSSSTSSSLSSVSSSSSSPPSHSNYSSPYESAATMPTPSDLLASFPLSLATNPFLHHSIYEIFKQNSYPTLPNGVDNKINEFVEPSRLESNVTAPPSVMVDQEKEKAIKNEKSEVKKSINKDKKVSKKKEKSLSCSTCSGNCADITCSISSVLPIDQSQLPMCLRGASEEQLNLANLFNTLMHHKKCRRTRTVFSDMQMIGLEKRFENQKYLSTPDRIQLAESLGLSQLQVKTWYQNRRMKWKKKVLKEGSQEAPTKPKGRPKKNSIPSFSDIIKAEAEAAKAAASAGGGGDSHNNTNNQSMSSYSSISKNSENELLSDDDEDDDDICMNDDESCSQIDEESEDETTKQYEKNMRYFAMKFGCMAGNNFDAK